MFVLAEKGSSKQQNIFFQLAHYGASINKIFFFFGEPPPAHALLMN